MATLSAAIPMAGSLPAILIPNRPQALAFSFEDLHAHVSGFQQQLAHLGVAPQHAISITLPNSYEFIVAFLAAAKQRAIAAPLNPAYTQDEFDFHIGDLDSALALVPQGSYKQNGPAIRAARNHRAAIAECFWNGREVCLEVKDLGKLAGKKKQDIQLSQPDDIALVLHTSGTTGRPKAILLRSPLPDKLPNIRFIRSCSSPLSPSTFHELEGKFQAPVLEAYAMTEAAHQIASNPLPPSKRIPGSVGVGHGVEVRILDQDGTEAPKGSQAEICIRGQNVTQGYLNNAAANESSFTAEGFFRTGDQGTQDEDGYVKITGRIKELINKGGEKISPVEIDNVVTQHPAVAEAVCFAVSDEIYGQDVGLAVVLEDGARVTQNELRDWMATKVAKFKVAKQVGICRSNRSDVLLMLDRFISHPICPRLRLARFNAGRSQR
ncbi:MAG: hypothetical protein Q9222_000351 [Ikaeria aurantiellina]